MQIGCAAGPASEPPPAIRKSRRLATIPDLKPVPKTANTDRSSDRRSPQNKQEPRVRRKAPESADLSRFREADPKERLASRGSPRRSALAGRRLSKRAAAA